MMLAVAPLLADGLAVAAPVVHARLPGIRFETKRGPGDGRHDGRVANASLGAKSGQAMLAPSLSEEAIVDPRFEVVRPDQMVLLEGVGYYATLEKSQGLPSDSDTGSQCVLLENGNPLGPAGPDWARIATVGGGAYSHWRPGQLLFSTSDNSNPISNGRTYSLDCTRQLVVTRSRVVATQPSSTFSQATTGSAVWNRRLVFRNLDASLAVRPTLRIRGSPDLSSREGILGSILAPNMTPEEASIAIWQLLADQAYNWHPAQDDMEVHDPVKLVNVYGYGYCDDFAQAFAALAQAAGIPARIWYLEGHVVPEAHYDGRWHMFDPDFRIFYRSANGNVLGVEELADDPTPILDRADYLGGPTAALLAGIFSSTVDNFVVSPPPQPFPHRVQPVLQPGDELAFDGGPASLARKKYLPDMPAAPLAGNGTLRRSIPVAGSPAEVVIPFDWPYVLVGGTITGDGVVSISANGVDWAQTRDLASWFAGRDEASYGFVVRVANPGPSLTLDVVFQFAPLSLPGVRPGTTTFDFDIEPVGGTVDEAWKGIEITQEWEDRAAPGTHAIAVNANPFAGGVAACSPDPVYHDGASTCTAIANAGYAFTGWSGDCTGLTCTLANVTSPRSVVAQFSMTSHAIAATASPAVGGTASCSPNPVNYGGSSICTAAASTGYSFAGWAGDCTGTTCTLSDVTAARSVTANFSLNGYPVAVTASPAGGGTASCSPNPVNYGGSSICTAAASTGYSFAGWSGDCTGTTCMLGEVTGARSVSATFEPLPSGMSRLVNLSTRVQVQTGNDALIGGFVIGGTEAKTVVIRARGPSLAAYGVTGTLADPVLQLFSGQTPIALNDNWGDGADAAALEASGFAPSDPREAAISATLAPGAYTAIVRGVSDGTGVGIIEVFEVGRPEPLLVNISTRGPVFSGSNPMIAGFIIQGSDPKVVVVRARGPSLANAGVAGFLVNPVLSVYSGTRAVAVNDDWQTLAEAPQLVAAGLAPGEPLEAAVILTLPPGAYTAVVNGTGTSSGIAIVEVFGL